MISVDLEATVTAHIHHPCHLPRRQLHLCPEIQFCAGWQRTCMCVYMYILYIYMHICISITCIQERVCENVCASVWLCVSVHIHTHLYYTYICVCKCMCVCVCVCVLYMYTCVCESVRAYVCV